MDESKALLPCPFCGEGKIQTWCIRDGRITGCKTCRATAGSEYHGPDGDATPRSIAAWNRRAAPPSQCGESKAVPAAEIVNKFGDPEAFAERELKVLVDIQKMSIGTKLYAAPPASPDRQALIDLIAEGLHDTYHCLRVWNAWNVGTMTQEDFEPVDESDTPAEIADSIMNLLAAPPAEPSWLPDHGAYLIRYDDVDRNDELFVSRFARQAALNRYRQISGQWNAHLFVKIDSNSRDEPVPSAAPPAERKPNPLCIMSWNGFNLSGDEKSIAEANRLLHVAGTVKDLWTQLEEAEARSMPSAEREPLSDERIDDLAWQAFESASYMDPQVDVFRSFARAVLKESSK